MQTKHDDHDDILAAARVGDLDEVAAVLSMDNRLTRATDDRGRTPLHLAAAGGHADTVDLLVHNNADVSARDTAGETPLALAHAAGHAAVVDLLRRNGAH